MNDQLVTGRRFRVLNIVDDVTRECIRAVVDRSISGRWVVREFADLVAERGSPKMIVSDNGTELTSNAVLAWQAAVERLHEEFSVACRRLSNSASETSAFLSLSKGSIHHNSLAIAAAGCRSRLAALTLRRGFLSRRLSPYPGRVDRRALAFARKSLVVHEPALPA